MEKSRILVVEDEFVVAADLEFQLQSMGYQVVGLASTGDRALELAGREEPDIALMDIKLKGGEDGLETARCLRQKLDIPVIFITAYAESDLLERAKRSEPFGYIVKPYSSKELRATIETALYKARKEKELRESENRYRTLAESSPSTVEVIQNGRFVYINPAGVRMFGFERPEDILGVPMLDVVAPEYRFKATERLGETEKGRSNPPGEFELIRRDGTRILVESVSAPTLYRNRPATLIIGHDITNRKRAETLLAETQKDLSAAQARLRELYHALQRTREDERRRVAREIHDDLGQNLTALQIEISLLKGIADTNRAPTTQRLASMEQLVNSALLTVQRISTELRPSVLDSLGLAAAVEWLAGDFKNRTRIECSTRIEPKEIRVGANAATDLFRILQECLTNVARHSRASWVRIHLEQTEEATALTVTDDGIGISDVQANGAAAFGLQGIRERISALGGGVDVQGIPGEGTTVAITIPREAGTE